jgi:hypothetical protein
VALTVVSVRMLANRANNFFFLKKPSINAILVERVMTTIHFVFFRHIYRFEAKTSLIVRALFLPNKSWVILIRRHPADVFLRQKFSTKRTTVERFHKLAKLLDFANSVATKNLKKIRLFALIKILRLNILMQLIQKKRLILVIRVVRLIKYILILKLPSMSFYLHICFVFINIHIQYFEYSAGTTRM